MATENLRKQLRSDVFNAFKEGVSKRSAKNSNDEKERIFSYSSKFNLLDRATDFANFVKTEFGTKIKKDKLTEEHFQKYLESKKEKCTQRTLDQYRYELQKIAKIGKLDVTIEKETSEKGFKSSTRGAKSVISREDFEKLKEYVSKFPDSKTAVAIELQCQIGVRASDLCYGITVTPEKLLICSKNGKIAKRDITPALTKIMAKNGFQDALDANGKYKPCKDSTLNKYLRVAAEKLGIEKHSCHDIRRRIAQDIYDECRQNGMTIEEAKEEVSKWLNHGENRDSLLINSYIEIW